MLGVGSSIQEPCLQAGQTLNGSRISRLFAQKIMWLKPNEEGVLVDALEPEVIDLEEGVCNTDLHMTETCMGTKGRDVAVMGFIVYEFGPVWHYLFKSNKHAFGRTRD